MNETEFNQIKAGSILYTSWGYDMTIVDFCKVIEKGKTLKCKMLGRKESDDDGLGNGRAIPINEEFGEFFRLRISRGRNDPSQVYLAGSYPFCDKEKRLGNFWIWDGKACYFNTWD